MTNALKAMQNNERAREILDWSVFSLGALSLTVAITATVISHFENISVASIDTAQDEIEVSVLPDVL